MTIRDSQNHNKWLNKSWFWGLSCQYNRTLGYDRFEYFQDQIFNDIKRNNNFSVTK